MLPNMSTPPISGASGVLSRRLDPDFRAWAFEGVDVQNYWDLAGRDVVPDLSARGQAADVGAAVLYALLSNSGNDFSAPYETVRTTLKIRKKQVSPEIEQQEDQRIRNFKVLFRGLGLLYDDVGILHATPFGEHLLAIMDEQYTAADDYARELFNLQRRKIAQLAVGPLSRVQLANPTSKSDYPPGTDIHPLRAIWFAMRNLDGKLHWEELGRCLTGCLTEEALPAAVERIRVARQDPTYDAQDPVAMESLLGPRTLDLGKNQSDRLDIWYSRAAFKNIFLEPSDREDKYRYLNSDFVDLIDEVLSLEPEFNPTDSVVEYMQWVGEAGPPIEDSETQEELVSRVVQRCRRYGDRQIVALVGPAGTGKTTCAWNAANVLAESDSTRISTVQFHAGFTYEEFIAGLAPDGKGGFEPKLGALLEINKAAQENPGKLYVLIVDELSRADVANVLGELLTYIEYRERKFEVPVLGTRVSIAPNLVIIATMNPADRSVVNMDDALIRRLRQVEVPRSTAALRSILSQAGAEPNLVAAVTDWFDGLPADAPFGHGVFVGVRDEGDLHDLWWESLQYFLRRGGLVVYPDAELIERGYVWKDSNFALRSAAEVLPPDGSA
ncbi:MAG: AAA family ATPase [Mycobacterium sp.]|nr:AAA family ATPase [Mycobacterium sp.]